MKRVHLYLLLCLATLAFVSCTARTGRSVDPAIVSAKVDTPSISPQTGSFPAGTLITISSSTQEATIKYTIDGSVPSATNGITYTQPIELSTPNIKAIAIKENMNNSEVATATYSVQAPYSPEFSQPGATYNNAVVVSLTAQGDYDEIKYTLDGSDPHNGTIYSAPILIDATGITIRAITLNGGVASAESSAAYVLKVATPTISHNTCPSVIINCGGGLNSLLSVNDLNAAVTQLTQGQTPPPVPINVVTLCTNCVFLAGATTGAAYEWRYIYTSGHPAVTTTTVWTSFCQRVLCSDITVPHDVTDFTIQARAKKGSMVDSDISSAQYSK